MIASTLNVKSTQVVTTHSWFSEQEVTQGRYNFGIQLLADMLCNTPKDRIDASFVLVTVGCEER